MPCSEHLTRPARAYRYWADRDRDDVNRCFDSLISPLYRTRAMPCESRVLEIKRFDNNENFQKLIAWGLPQNLVTSRTLSQRHMQQAFLSFLFTVRPILLDQLGVSCLTESGIGKKMPTAIVVDHSPHKEELFIVSSHGRSERLRMIRNGILLIA